MKNLKILIPVDGTEFSEAIFPKLAILGKPNETEILLLRVSGLAPMPVQVTPGLPGGGYSPVLAEANMRHAIIDEMEPEAKQLTAMGYAVQREVGFGEPAQQILFFADMAKVDLIAMTTHGREGISRLLAGSVAEAVLHKSKVPVLMIRPEEVSA